MDCKFTIIMTIATAIMEVLFFAGNIFGWSLLQFILEEEGYFGYQCNSTATNITITSNQSTIVDDSKCKDQKTSFNIVFTLAVTFLMCMSFPFGYLLDRFGTWIYRTIAAFIYSLGYVLLAISNPTSSGWLYPAMTFIGVSGLGLMVSNVQLGNLVPSARGVIITLLNGAFDSSVLVYFLFKKGYDNGASIFLIYYAMAWATVFIWLRTFIFMPKKSILPSCDSQVVRHGWKEWSCFLQPQVQERVKVIEHAEIIVDSLSNCSQMSNQTTEAVVENQTTFKDCLRKTIFWTNILQFAVLDMRLNFFLGNLLLWLEGFTPKNEISGLLDAAGYITMFGALVAPLNGLIIDLVIKTNKKKLKDMHILNLKATFVSILITTVFAIVLSILIAIQLPYPSFIFLLLTRSFLFGGCTAFTSMIFPNQHFGKLLGLNNLIAGLVDLLQFATVKISLSFDPTMFYINIAFLILTILTLIHPLMIFIDIRKNAM